MFETFDTRAVHAGREDFGELGVHAPPLDLSTTYPLRDLNRATASLDAFAAGAGSAPDAIYGRLFNPTVARFERALATLEQTETSVAFGSGMAAITAVLLDARARGGDAGAHVVAVRPMYGGTDHLLSSGLLGLDVTWADSSQVREAIQPNTALVLVETPANPTCELVDIAQVVAAAGDVPVMVDSTFATPVLQRPARHGATLVLHSATKFLGGHGDVIAGVVACDEETAKRLRQVRVLTGALLHPMGAWLLHRGLPTLAMRVERAQASATLLAERLGSHPAINRVWYPGHAGGDPGELIGRQMMGPGAVLAFEMRGGLHAAADVLRSCQLITPAVSLGSVDSLIQHPAGLTHRIVSEAGREQGGVTAGMLRLSVGVEGAEDLWRDLSRALKAAAGAQRPGPSEIRAA